MALSRRELLLGGSAAAAVGVATLLNFEPSGKKRKDSLKVTLGSTTWSVPVAEEGESLIELLRDYFHTEFKEGPWSDGSKGRLLVYIKDSKGNTLVGEDLEVVINGQIVPNLGLEFLLARPNETYEIDRSRELAKRYPFFQLHS